MPWGWIVFSTATAPDLEPFVSDPVGMRDYVSWVVEQAGATLEDLYFEVGADRGHAIVKDLDDYLTARAVGRILGATSYTKLLDPEQAADSMSQEDDLRRSPPSAD
jgi:hypothetical protein